MLKRHTIKTSISAGVTLIELVVVLALIGALLLVAVPTFRVLFGVDLNTSTHQLASTARYMRDEAVLRNVPLRMAFDLDRQAWWIELADGPARIFRDRDSKEAFDEFMVAKAESDERVAEDAERRRSMRRGQGELMTEMFGAPEEGAGPQGMDLLGGLFGGGGFAPGAKGGEYQANQFSQYGGDDEHEIELFAPRQLPDGVRFMGAWTPQHGRDIVEPMNEYELEAMLREPPEEQKWTVVYTHIFPSGYVEDSVIYLSDLDGETIRSITTEPLTGRVIVTEGRAEIPDLADREQRQ